MAGLDDNGFMCKGDAKSGEKSDVIAAKGDSVCAKIEMVTANGLL